MCGIVGLVSSSKPASFDVVTNMLEKIQHRGPDDFVVKNYGKSVLGMVRLSITDHIGGRQPFISMCGRYEIFFNGEIYNHVEVRKELALIGVEFKSNSDTEVLLYALIKFGPEKTIVMLRGMYAFCLLDKLEEKYTLARDPWGMKPLFFSKASDCFSFCSEVEPLLHLQKEVQYDSDAIDEYLTFGSVAAPKTIYRHIYKIIPGEILTVSKKSKEGLLYSSVIVSLERLLGIVSEQYFSSFERTLHESVERHLRSDVPNALFLSGGKDSASIALVATQLGIRPICYTYDNGRASTEIGVARRIASVLRLELREVKLQEDEIEEKLIEVMLANGEPSFDLALLPLFELSRRARKDGIRVVLSGEGSDELFLGYAERWMGLSYWARFEGMKPKSTRDRFWYHRSSSTKLGRLLKRIDLSIYDSVLYSRSDGPLAQQFKDLNTPALFTNHVERLRRVFQVKRQAQNDRAFTSWVSHAKYHDLQNNLPDSLLVKADRMTMRNSIELRCPFLDLDFLPHSKAAFENINNELKSSKLQISNLLDRNSLGFLNELPKKGFAAGIHHCVSQSKLLRTSLKKSIYASSEILMADKNSMHELFRMVEAGDKNGISIFIRLASLSLLVDRKTNG